MMWASRAVVVSTRVAFGTPSSAWYPSTWPSLSWSLAAWPATKTGVMRSNMPVTRRRRSIERCVPDPAEPSAMRLPARSSKVAIPEPWSVTS